MIEEVLMIVFAMLFLLSCTSAISAYEIVSDDYSVESFSIASSSDQSESSIYNSRDVLSTDPGTYFEGNEFYGELKKYPEEVISGEQDESVDSEPSGGGGGGGASISGDLGDVIVECENNLDCERGFSCVNNECINAYDLEIVDFDSFAKMGEYFNFTYSVRRNLDDTAMLDTTIWIEDYYGNILAEKYGQVQILPFEEKEVRDRILLPQSIKDEAYVFYVRIDDTEATLIDLEDVDVRIRGEYVYFRRIFNWFILVIAGGSLLLSLTILGIIYNKKLIALWVWFKKKKWNAWMYRLRESYWRIFHEK